MPYPVAGSSTQTATLTHLATVYYERKSLDRLTAKFRFAAVCEPHDVPLNSGKTIQMKRYLLPGFNTTPSSEGVTSAPIPQASTTISATVETYSDYEAATTLLVDTDISDTKDQMMEDLSYRAAGSVDTIIRLEADSIASVLVNTQGAFFSAQDSKAQVALMEGQNIRPRDDGNRYYGVCHPYNVFDLITDNTAGGFIEAMKYQNGQAVLNGEVGEVGRVRWLTSTNVATSGTAPTVLYSAYIFGQGALGIVNLAGRGPDHVVDPRMERFNISWVPGGKSPVDPTGEIAGYASFRHVFTAKNLDPTVPRFRRIACDASVI